jgi:hypothetical protein
MWIQRAAIAVLILTGPGAAAQPANLNCRIGPIEKTYGGTKWNVYGFDDKKSIVIVTAPGNPAMPFYFFFLPNGDGYQLHGEGTGDKKITDAAYKDLAALPDSDIAALVAEASGH